jgi:hypothetical protein
MLKRYVRKPLSYSLVLDGIRPLVSCGEGSLQRDIRNRVLTGEAVRIANDSPGLQLSAEATQILVAFRRAVASKVPVIQP